MGRLLKERYKTYEGASKRAAFENGLARGEYERGDKAKLYRYYVVRIGFDIAYRVKRERRDDAPSATKETRKMFTLKVNTANAAFDNEGAELARILHGLAYHLAGIVSERCDVTINGTLRDSSGNTVGKWELK